MDTLLADKQGLDTELTALIRAKVPQGAEIDSAGVKDIILPGEIRSILTRVVEAENPPKPTTSAAARKPPPHARC